MAETVLGAHGLLILTGHAPRAVVQPGAGVADLFGFLTGGFTAEAPPAAGAVDLFSFLQGGFAADPFVVTGAHGTLVVTGHAGQAVVGPGSGTARSYGHSRRRLLQSAAVPSDFKGKPDPVPVYVLGGEAPRLVLVGHAGAVSVSENVQVNGQLARVELRFVSGLVRVSNHVWARGAPGSLVTASGVPEIITRNYTLAEDEFVLLMGLQ